MKEIIEAKKVITDAFKELPELRDAYIHKVLNYLDLNTRIPVNICKGLASDIVDIIFKDNRPKPIFDIDYEEMEEEAE